MTETLVYRYSYESTKPDTYNEYQHDRVFNGFQNTVCPCALDELILSIGRINQLTFIVYSSKLGQIK